MIIGPNYDTDKEGWLAARAGNTVSATEVRDLYLGYGADRARIIAEKLDGLRTDLAGNKYIEHGHQREKIIEAWIMRNFAIPPSNDLIISSTDRRWIATPDGIQKSAFGIVVSEIKTSKSDIRPGKLDDDHRLVTTQDKKSGRLVIVEPGQAFISKGYWVQMQWQMHVTGAEETLYAWEQHDDDWSEWPRRGPKPLSAQPLYAWIPRDYAFIEDLLVDVVDPFFAELDAIRATRAAAGDTPQAPSELDAEIERLGREVAEGRALEARGKALKEPAWAKLQELLAGKGTYSHLDEDTGIKVTVGTSSPPAKRVFNRERALQKAPKTIANYEALVERYTELMPQEGKATLTVTVPNKEED